MKGNYKSSIALTLLLIIIIGLTCSSQVQANSYADSVYTYSQGSTVGTRTFNGITYTYTNATNALGAPDFTGVKDINNINDADSTSVSLGNYGSIILKFTDNFLTTSGNSNYDLRLFEVGGVQEDANIFISSDALSWYQASYTKSWIGFQRSIYDIDIDSIAGITSGQTFSYVKIVDLGSQTDNVWAGFDLDAVEALTSIPTVPIPGAIWLLGSGIIGLIGFRRKSSGTNE